MFNDEKYITKYGIDVRQLEYTMFDILTPNELEAMDLYFHDGIPMKDIKKYLKHPPWSGNYLIKSAIKKLNDPKIYKRFMNRI